MAHGIEVKNHFVIDILTGDDIARHHLRQYNYLGNAMN